jgi:riboflavin synthase
MFTGIVEELGEVVAVDDLGDSVRLRVHGPLTTSDAAPGDSVAVNGCCLTVVDLHDGAFDADVMKETLQKTSLGVLRPGAPVNLERAVTALGRLGGHLVQGHVDGTGVLCARAPSEHWEVIWVELPPRLAKYVAVKGSVAVDGVSLTVVELRDNSSVRRPAFSVSLVPSTLERTTLGTKAVGEPVNLEVDVIAKYVERLLAAAGAGGNAP